MHDAPAFDSVSLADGVSLHAGADTAAARALLTPNAVSFVAKLHRKMNGRRVNLLFARASRYAAWDRGDRPDYLPATELPEARANWQVAPLPADLQTRRVEITGPVSDARMVINMLSRTADGHRADCAMVDFEDSMKPSWTNVIQGVHNVIEAAQGTLRAEKVDAGGQVLKTYQLDPDDAALLMVRVRGLHLDESNLHIDGEPVSGALLDFALCAFHAAPLQIQRGATPKFYLPKVEHHLEARWFADLFKMAEDELGFERSTLRCTLLIETLPAAYQMEEILYQIREHAAGLNGGRWDKIFSDIKCLKNHESRVLADRATIGMNREWMSNYAKQLIRVCHQHGAFGMGGMAAFTPGRDAARRDEQTAKVVADKEFEAGIGHDGCWVSHPYFIGPALAPFEKKLAETGASNQLSVLPDLPAQPDLLPKPTGPKTMDGLRTNLRVAIAYMRGWHADQGVVAWDDLMEDLATFEISRAQVFQWKHNAVQLDSGETVDAALVSRLFGEELAQILTEIDAAEHDAYRAAAAEAEAIFLETEMRPFLAMASDLAGAPIAQTA